MPGKPTKILLVTPVWKDSARLADFGDALARALAASSLPVRWVIADDGSPADEAARLTELREAFSRVFPHVEVHLAARHHGKGAVVREAWALAPEAEWLAFVDADGAVLPEDFLALVRRAVAEDNSVLGIRKRTATTRIVESFWRSLAHRGFLLVARLLLDLECEDPQCGAKVIKGDDYRAVAHQLRENGLAFDSELLAALRQGGAAWSEIPVSWTEKQGGRVKPLRDAWGMVVSLLRIRFLLGNARHSHSQSSST